MSANNKTERKLVENYLTQHDLEVTINEVVNFCVRERPRDPFEFMARAILEKSTTVKGVTGVSAYQVLDGNGVPCLEVVVKTERGEFRAQVPSDNELLDPWRRPINTSKPAQDFAEASLEANLETTGDAGGGDAEAKSGEGKDGSDQTSFKKPATPPYVQLRDGDENAFGGLGVLSIRHLLTRSSQTVTALTTVVFSGRMQCWPCRLPCVEQAQVRRSFRYADIWRHWQDTSSMSSPCRALHYYREAVWPLLEFQQWRLNRSESCLRARITLHRRSVLVTACGAHLLVWWRRELWRRL
jgi:hypothetical protein